MWQVGLVILKPRPLARGMKRFRLVPCSTWMVVTVSSSMSAPWLCSALAIADSSTLRMILAPFFGLNASRLSALSTGRPRTWSATSRPFWADRRTPRKMAEVLMVISPIALLLAGRCRRRWRSRARCRGRRAGSRGDDLLVPGMRLERAGQRKFAELVSDHVFAHIHRHVLPAVVNGDGESDKIRKNG